MNASEVARLLQQIKDEYEAAALGLTGIAQTGRHQFITRHMENMGQAHQALQGIVGTEQATILVAETVWSSEERARS